MRILHTDFDALVLDNDVLVEKNIHLRTSALYKHQQNLAGAMSVGLWTVSVPS
jgi:hypothetical protein